MQKYKKNYIKNTKKKMNLQIKMPSNNNLIYL